MVLLRVTGLHLPNNMDDNVLCSSYAPHAHLQNVDFSWVHFEFWPGCRCAFLIVHEPKNPII